MSLGTSNDPILVSDDAADILDKVHSLQYFTFDENLGGQVYQLFYNPGQGWYYQKCPVYASSEKIMLKEYNPAKTGELLKLKETVQGIWQVISNPKDSLNKFIEDSVNFNKIFEDENK
jgi:hypothetical protein